jgi:hypothetical protein
VKSEERRGEESDFVLSKMDNCQHGMNALSEEAGAYD